MQNQEILAVIILGILLGLVFIAFIVTIIFLYQKRQQQHKIEMATMQEEYDQQILRVQFEMQESILASISNKLHDAVKNNVNAIAVSVSAIAMKLGKGLINTVQATESLNELSEDLKLVKEEIRLTSHSLSSDRISQVGLVDAIRFEIKRIQKDSQMLVQFNEVAATEFKFMQEESVYIFRMFQECVGNVLSHSKATELAINISAPNRNSFLLEIIDNGIGFNINEKKKSKLSGIGLAGMQKRAIQIGGDFKINSTPNIGTHISIKLPLTDRITFKATTNNDDQKPKYSFS